MPRWRHCASGRYLWQRTFRSGCLSGLLKILRDLSHVRTLPLSELLHIFRDAGLETEMVSTADDLCPEVERWMATTNVPEERAAEIRQLLEDDLQQDLSGTRPFRNAAGQMFFHARTVMLSGRKTGA